MYAPPPPHCGTLGERELRQYRKMIGLSTKKSHRQKSFRGMFGEIWKFITLSEARQFASNPMQGSQIHNGCVLRHFTLLRCVRESCFNSCFHLKCNQSLNVKTDQGVFHQFQWLCTICATPKAFNVQKWSSLLAEKLHISIRLRWIILAAVFTDGSMIDDQTPASASARALLGIISGNAWKQLRFGQTFITSIGNTRYRLSSLRRPGNTTAERVSKDFKRTCVSTCTYYWMEHVCVRVGWCRRQSKHAGPSVLTVSQQRRRRMKLLGEVAKERPWKACWTIWGGDHDHFFHSVWSRFLSPLFFVILKFPVAAR